MAGPIQIGDAIRLAELACKIYDLGWSSEKNAGKNYRAFGAEVATLQTGLEKLEDAIQHAQKSLRKHGAQTTDTLGGDQSSLKEIIGDYEATLNECNKLLADNKLFAEAMGPMKNIDWNFNVMPRVNHLRSRIEMHNLRIQHVVKPFEIDLINNFQGVLVQRMEGLRVDLRRVSKNVDTLIALKFPDVEKAIEKRMEREVSSLRIPDPLRIKLDAMFENHNLERQPTLHDMTDCFLIQLERTTVISVKETGKPPPVEWYLALFKCQLLMDRIKESPELHVQNPWSMSHWPGYVGALEEKFSQHLQSSRVETEMMELDVSDCEDSMLEIWNMDSKPMEAAQPGSRRDYIDLAEVSLALESSSTVSRKIRVSRRVDYEHRFRLVETYTFRGQPQVEESQTIDINIRKTALIPIYANPLGKGGTPPPLQIIVEDSTARYSFEFMELKGLLLFQQALTGFRVVEDFMESRAYAVFVGKKSIGEDATLQLWVHSPLEVNPEISRENDYRRPSSGSQESMPSTQLGARRSNSVFSSRSSSAFSATCYSSSSTKDTTVSRPDHSPPTAGYGVTYPPPRKPLLVMFTKVDDQKRAIVAITIDDETMTNPERCNCQKYKDCCITALERRPSNLRATRLENRAKWNLLHLASTADNWTDLLRISILFPTVEARHRFGGGYCTCRTVTEGQMNECMKKGHRGLLGTARVYYRRLMILWEREQEGDKLVGGMLG